MVEPFRQLGYDDTPVYLLRIYIRKSGYFELHFGIRARIKFASIYFRRGSIGDGMTCEDRVR
jgi:hypothetical protein